MPNRLIKESICTSDSIDELDWFDEVLFYRLIVSCDDFGRYDGRPAIIKNRLFPLKEALSIMQVNDALNKLALADLITLYEVNGHPYLFLNTWESHQTIRAKKSKYPSPEDGTIKPASNCKQLQADENNCKQLQTNAPVIQSNPIQSYSYSGVGGKIVNRFSPPTLEEVWQYCQERRNGIDPQHFIDFYESKGWMIGKNKMKDWKAAVRNWEKREDDKPKSRNAPCECKPIPAVDPNELFARVEMI